MEFLRYRCKSLSNQQVGHFACLFDYLSESLEIEGKYSNIADLQKMNQIREILALKLHEDLGPR